LLGKKDKNGTPKYQPKDIAILLRSRGPQNLFEKHLRLLNIPYASENLSSFFFGGPVNDLMSVLRLAAYPLDRAAYAEMLRSPFIGLSLPALVSCIAAINESPSAEPFGNEPLPLLPEEERNKYIHGQQVYQKIRNGACSKTICSLVSELWYGEGYRYETEWNPQTSVFRELYDYLFHLATRADEENQNLAAFIDTIQKYYEKKDRLDDIEIPLDHHSTLTGGTVTLMSIHKSKGLEFPVVFLCCCDKYIRKSHGSTIFSIGESGITLNPPLPVQCVNIPDIKRNYFWERSIAAEKGKRTAELRRLLYVGMTRAEKELYLSGCMEIGSEDENGKPESADGFLQSVKRHIEELIAGTKKKNSINGDTIIDNDTFFGLCLPSFGAHIPADSPGTTFFNIEKIPVYSEEYINDAEQKASTLPNDQNGLNAFFELVEPYYKSTTVIETPAAPNRYYSPTSLKTKGIDVAIDGTSCEFSISNEYSGENAKDVFSKVDVMLDRYAKQYGEDNEKFNSGSFGTIAHICAEALLAGKEAIIPPGLGGFLSPAGAEAFLNAGKELALRFIRSPLGIIAKNSLKRKSEFPFRSLVNIGENEFFINGIIDLVFEDDKTVYVVDFKTDLNELPMEHASQMACYHRAVSDLFAAQAGKKCRTWLYYLRTGHAVELGFNSQ
jgi:ATP-dependent helicase/nuclease subunit A